MLVSLRALFKAVAKITLLKFFFISSYVCVRKSVVDCIRSPCTELLHCLSLWSWYFGFEVYCQCSGNCRILTINQEFHSRIKIVYIVRFHPLLNSVLCWPTSVGSAELFMLLLHCRRAN